MIFLLLLVSLCFSDLGFTKEGLQAMRVRELKTILKRMDDPCLGCVEKIHLIDRILERQEEPDLVLKDLEEEKPPEKKIPQQGGMPEGFPEDFDWDDIDLEKLDDMGFEEMKDFKVEDVDINDMPNFRVDDNPEFTVRDIPDLKLEDLNLKGAKFRPNKNVHRTPEEKKKLHDVLRKLGVDPDEMDDPDDSLDERIKKMQRRAEKNRKREEDERARKQEQARKKVEEEESHIDLDEMEDL